MVAATGDAKQLNLYLHGGLSIGEAFGNVLLDATGGLYHLIDGAVTVAGQETVAESLGQLHQHIALAEEVEFLVQGGFAEHAGCTVAVALQGDVLGVGHGVAD